MLLTKQNVNSPVFFSSLFDEIINAASSPAEKRKWIPAVNLSENDEGYGIEVAAPGFSRDQFELKEENGILHISGKTEAQPEEKKEKFSRKEFSFGQFQRSFQLPEEADANNIVAKYDAGILKIHIPKKEKEAVVVHNISIE